MTETKWYRPDQRPDNDDIGAPEISQTVLLYCPKDKIHALGWFNFDTDQWSSFEDFYFIDGWMWTHLPKFTKS